MTGGMTTIPGQILKETGIIMKVLKTTITGKTTGEVATGILA
jgi:hypothetical protein